MVLRSVYLPFSEKLDISPGNREQRAEITLEQLAENMQRLPAGTI